MDPRAPYEAPLIDRLLEMSTAAISHRQKRLYSDAAHRIAVLEHAYEPVQFLREQLDTLGIADHSGTLFDTETGQSLASILAEHRRGYTRTLLPM